MRRARRGPNTRGNSSYGGRCEEKPDHHETSMEVGANETTGSMEVGAITLFFWSPSTFPPFNINRTSIVKSFEGPSKVYRKSIGNLSNSCRTSIGILSNIYRAFLEHTPSIPDTYIMSIKTFIQHLSSINRSIFLASTGLDGKRETISLICLIIFNMFDLFGGCRLQGEKRLMSRCS